MDEDKNRTPHEGLRYQTPEDLQMDAQERETGADLAPSLEASIEAVLFASGDPVPLAKIAAVIGLQADHTRRLLEEMSMRADADPSRGVTIQRVEDTYLLSTKASMRAVMRVLFQPRNRPPLSQAAYETLAIVAYNQPVTRSRIEAVRGVGSDGILARLVERGLVRACGTLDAPGRPTLFETTDTFLREFGLVSVTDLPPMEMLMIGTLRGIESALDATVSSADDRQITVDQLVSSWMPQVQAEDAAESGEDLLTVEPLYREEEDA